MSLRTRLPPPLRHLARRSNCAPPASRPASTTTHLYPSGARLALPSSSSSSFSPSSSRPLSFPQGATLGFLLGFTLCTALGYLYLLPTSTSRLDADVAAQLAAVQRSATEMAALVDEMKARGVREGQIEETVRMASGVRREMEKWKEAAERMQRRVVGLEEEGREVRRRVNRLEGKRTPSEIKREAAALMAGGDAAGDDSVASTGKAKAAGSRGVIWTGRSDPSTRLV